MDAYEGAEGRFQRASEVLESEKAKERHALDLLDRSQKKFARLEEQAATVGQFEVSLLKEQDAKAKHQDHQRHSGLTQGQ